MNDHRNDGHKTNYGPYKSQKRRQSKQLKIMHRRRKGLVLRSNVKHSSDSEKKANHFKQKTTGSIKIWDFRRGTCNLPSETTAMQKTKVSIVIKQKCRK